MTPCNFNRGLDKLLHLIVGIIIALSVGCIFASIPPHMPLWSVVAALSVVALIASVKEVHDALSKGNHFCLWDWLWTFAGGIAVAWIPWLIAYLLAVNG